MTPDEDSRRISAYSATLSACDATPPVTQGNVTDTRITAPRPEPELIRTTSGPQTTGVGSDHQLVPDLGFLAIGEYYQRANT